MRYSRQRELILQSLKSDFSHPTAEEICEKVRKEEPTISLGTVYRNLNQLAENGDILRISGSGICDRYDFARKPHYHFRCTRCGCVTDLDDAYTAEIRQLSEKLGATDILAEGICDICKGEIQ